MQFQLNIGLDVPHTVANHARQAAKAIEMMMAMGFNTICMRTEQSATEPTLVVSLHAGNRPARVYADIARLAETLGQDCIAVYCPQTHSGALCGPKSADWGVFNKDNFIQLTK